MQINLTSETLSIDNKLVIDARKNVTEANPKGWVNRQAYKELGNIWQELRKTFVEGKDVGETLKELIVNKFSVNREAIETVEIEGGIPEHWKEMKEGKIKFR